MSEISFFNTNSLKGTEYQYIMNEQILICYRGGLVESKIFFSSSPIVKWFPTGVTRGGMQLGK